MSSFADMEVIVIMPTQPTGFVLPLSLPRRLLCAYHDAAARVPAGVVERRLNLAGLADLRFAALPRPGWCAVFTKAWAMVCARSAPLRRAYLSWPWARLYQHPVNVASVAVARPYGGDEEAVFFAQITCPEALSLVEIDRRLHWFKDRPFASSAALRRQLRFAQMPSPLRGLALRAALDLNGRHRARLLGTFGVFGDTGAARSILQPRGLLTSTLQYGRIDGAGRVEARIGYDARTLDGGAVARALEAMERILQQEICAELRYLEGLKVAAAA